MLLEDIPGVVRTLLEEFKKGREPAETFTDWWGRTHENGDRPHPSQFHEELTARAARREGKA